MRTLLKIAVVGLAATIALSGCTAPETVPDPPTQTDTASRNASKLFVKETQVCFFNVPSAADPVSVFFGTKMYPTDYYLNGNVSKPAGKGGPLSVTRSTGWACTDTRNDVTWDVPGTVDVLTTITFANGRSTVFGFANPSLEAPMFYPANERNGQGPGAGQYYKIPEGKTYNCSILGYDFKVTRRPDDSYYKYWTVEFMGKAAVTDDFDSTICKP